MTIKSNKQILKRIKEWQKKKDDAEPKSLEHGIADNAIVKLQRVVNEKLGEDWITRQIARENVYIKMCQKSKEIKQKKINWALEENERLKHKKKGRQREIVPTFDNDQPVESVPQAMIIEYEWVMN